MRRSVSFGSFWAALALLVLTAAFLYRPWWDFAAYDFAQAGLLLPPQVAVGTVVPVENYSGVRLLLREGVALLALLPAAIVIGLWALRAHDQRQAGLLALAGGLGLAAPVLLMLGRTPSWVNADALGDGLWLAAIAAGGLLLTGLLGLPALQARLPPITLESAGAAQRRARLISLVDWLTGLPWWLIVTLLLGVLLVWSLSANETYQQVFNALKDGILTTLGVTLIGYGLSLGLGLAVGIARVSRNPLIFHTATFYVEIVRGVPMLVLLYYIVFVIGPALVNMVTATGGWMLDSSVLPALGEQLAGVDVRNFTFTARVIVALMLGYGAFLAEEFRAGIEAVHSGQMEAARSLGMSYFQAMRYVVLPQAFRIVLPPLGNAFIAMLKDSSLVSVLGIRDITLLGQFHLTSSFKFFEVYNTVAFLYLAMTLLLSLFVRYIEHALDEGRPLSPLKWWRLRRRVQPDLPVS